MFVNRSTLEQCAQELKKQAVNRTPVSTSPSLRSVPLKGVRIWDYLIECRNKKVTYTAVLKKGSYIQHNFVPKAFTSLTHGRHESLIKAFIPTREFCELIGLKFILGRQGCIRSTTSETSSHLIRILWWRNYPVRTFQILHKFVLVLRSCKRNRSSSEKFTIYRSKLQNGNF